MMTLHKLHAGDGYTYLTRQVASGDVYRSAGQDLVAYYTASGNPPGRWIGAGAADLAISGTVREDQMRSLYGAGLHPDAEQIIALEVTNGADSDDARRATQFGRAFPVYQMPDTRAARIAARIERYERKTGHTPDATARARIEASEAAKERRAVAGYDLVFTPVKSASLLWGLGDAATRQAVTDAHHAAVASVLSWLERETCFARIGDYGERQIDARGFIAAAFDHFDSRAGDPDLHTHVAISNKVRAVHDRDDGTPRWLSLDARALHAAAVAASERYNTRMEAELFRRLGVTFTERPDNRRSDKRPIREIDGVPHQLIRHFSKRRAAVEERYRELADDYRRDHATEPDTAMQLRLAQQATLDTRGPKSVGVPLHEKIQMWRAEASSVIGGGKVRGLVRTTTDRAERVWNPDDVPVDLIANVTTAVVAERKSTWTRWNIIAEIERQTRHLRFTNPADREAITERILDQALSPAVSVSLGTDRDLPAVVARRENGESVLTQHGSERYTNQAMLDAEARLLEAAAEVVPLPITSAQASLSLDRYECRSGEHLDDDQRALVLAFSTTSRRLALGIGPAGSGKTTAMRALAAVWTNSGGRVIPLAPSATAAHVLENELRCRAENLHKFQHLSQNPNIDDDWASLRQGDLVLVDEATLAGTHRLDGLVQYARTRGAVVRLLGDPYQLSSVDAGGAFRLLIDRIGGAELTGLRRFRDPAAAQATLAIRRGDPTGIEYFLDSGLAESGSDTAMLSAAYDGWARDTHAGLRSLIITTNDRDALALNLQARRMRVRAGTVEENGVTLRDESVAGVGDLIVTRRNDRRLRSSDRSSFVKNGDTWTVTTVGADGGLRARSSDGTTIDLPSDYVANHTQLAYAMTAMRAQGATVDTAHVVVDEATTREALYVALTRSREPAREYVTTERLGAIEPSASLPSAKPSGRDVLANTLSRTNLERSAHALRTGVHSQATID
ncbi:relaxase domain-containing protein [Mumia zhuanghuii]|uniref:MobF family relaxase n=2 Tax=Mumia TaxID=1546255 RepID=A0ABW1QHD7_9ACTN|nr:MULTISPECIES: MobF family relaxase [Mumia]KAA1418134.1 relaxase domain-containing protein [Mumia zhuanghuii]